MNSDKNIKVLWIDDEIDRSEDAKNISYKRQNLRIDVLHPKGDRMKTRLSEIKNRNNLPDIFLIDYFLDRVPEKPNGEKYETRALALAGKIRESLSEYPIYVITNKETEPEGVFTSEAQAARAIFENIFSFKNIQRDGHDILYYDALDYRTIRNSRRQSSKVLFNLLQAPEEIRDRLSLILPDELQHGLASIDGLKNPQGNSIAFARWVRKSLIKIPGFIYDELHASTHLGMDTSFFANLSSRFSKARYKGIFAKTSPHSWWVTKLNDILFSYVKAQKSEKTYPWEIAQIVFNIPKKHKSRCVVCNETLPETVGINLNDEKELKPVHYKCSKPHPAKKRTLYFDELRTFEL